jgi:hypothetical protein
MLRNSIIITLIFFFVNAQSQNLKVLPNYSYSDNEVLKFDMRYGFIVGGEVVLTLTATDSNNTKMYHLTGCATTVGLADKIYKVKDIYESYFNENNCMPVLAVRNISEGHYKFYDQVRYNRQNNTVLSQKNGELKVPSNVMDMASVFYYIRRIDMSGIKEDQSIKLNTYFGDGLFPFEVIYRGKEIIDTKWGKIRCLKFAPIVEPGRVFKKKDDMLIWYTDDSNRIPIKVTMGMIIGHVTVELKSYANLRSNMIFSEQ